MAHHKRKRPKTRRAGCLLCKPHKRNGTKLLEREPAPARRVLQELIDEKPRIQQSE
jgi:hypothetical protein